MRAAVVQRGGCIDEFMEFFGGRGRSTEPPPRGGFKINSNDASAIGSQLQGIYLLLSDFVCVVPA